MELQKQVREAALCHRRNPGCAAISTKNETCTVCDAHPDGFMNRVVAAIDEAFDRNVGGIRDKISLR